MDFMRIEGENNFLVFLPKDVRQKEHDSWYRGIGADTHEYALEADNFDWTESKISYTSDNPKLELFQKLKLYLARVLDHRYDLSSSENSSLQELAKLQGSHVSILPELSVIRLKKTISPDKVYTLLLNRAHSNVGVLYLETLRLLPQEDTLTLVPGFLGAYPNAFFVVHDQALPSFVQEIGSLSSEDDYAKLMDHFGIRRTNPDFWAHSDWFQDSCRKLSGGNYGVLDYSRLENR